MVDITFKNNTLRIAKAQATVAVSSSATMEIIKNNQVPKGDIFEMAKAAGLLATKNTYQTIPDCHPLPIEGTTIKYEIDDLNINIFIEVKTIYKTGVEVEAMHGASIAALTMYDMLKPVDKGIEIKNIKLVQKKGGKTDFAKRGPKNLKAGVVVCSDSVSDGKKEDKAGKEIITKLEKFEVSINKYLVIPDEKNKIENSLTQLVDEGIDLIIFTGGTGLSPRDITPETILPLLDREIPGISEAMRNYGQERTPYAMLSRSLAGTIGESLVLALPGSTKGAGESMNAIFPSILHLFKVIKGFRHD